MSAVHPHTEQRILLFSVFILSLCGIVYELVLGSLATYLLGNPVQQYSITIGIFLSSMGLGSYLSRYITKDLVRNFILIEAVLGLVGGVSVTVLSVFFTYLLSFYALQFFFLIGIGVLVGLEIPLVTRILKKHGSLRDIISNVLTFDYVGGLIGSLLFPLVLFPFVGRYLTSVIVGSVNIAVALFLVVVIDYPGKRRWHVVYPIACLIIMGVLAGASGKIGHLLQRNLYADDIVFSKRSSFQEIVLTRSGDDFRLFLDGALQFSTFDEYRYHEMLVFPALLMRETDPKSVLVMGGGDGLAVREIKKMRTVQLIHLVELDPEMIRLSLRNPSFQKINDLALHDPRVRITVGDAHRFLMEHRRLFDVIIADFPDPHDETIAKLYTEEFFRLVAKNLAPDGVFVTQSTSPLFAREAFWCIHNTMKRVFPSVVPYRVYVPTFGEWGFNIGSKKSLGEIRLREHDTAVDARYYTRTTFMNALHFAQDNGPVDTRINTFNTPVLYSYYVRGWKSHDL